MGAPDANGMVVIRHTVMPFNAAQPMANTSMLLNMGPATGAQRVRYDVQSDTLRSTNLFTAGAVASPVVSNVVNLKAQYGLDTDNDGVVDAWQDATGPTWAAANLPTQPLATLQQIRAVRVAIVTRSAQHERTAVTTGPLTMFDGAVSMTLSGDEQNYRYKVLETIVPLRNALWNAT